MNKILNSISFTYYATKVQNLTQKLSKIGIENLDKVDDLIDELQTKTLKLANHPFMKLARQNPQTSEQFNSIFSLSAYMIQVNRGEFESAFSVSEEAYQKSTTPGIKQVFLVNMVDSLCLIKSHLKTDEEKAQYQKQHGVLENHYCNLLEDLIHHDAIEKYGKSPKKVANIHYNGSFMALAYIKHLNQDETSAQEYMTSLIATQGVEQVKKYEVFNQATGWFYRHHDDNYCQFAQAACDKFESKMKQHQTHI